MKMPMIELCACRMGRCGKQADESELAGSLAKIRPAPFFLSRRFFRFAAGRPGVRAGPRVEQRISRRRRTLSESRILHGGGSVFPHREYRGRKRQAVLQPGQRVPEIGGNRKGHPVVRKGTASVSPRSRPEIQPGIRPVLSSRTPRRRKRPLWKGSYSSGDTR